METVPHVPSRETAFQARLYVVLSMTINSRKRFAVSAQLQPRARWASINLNQFQIVSAFGNETSELYCTNCKARSSAEPYKAILKKREKLKLSNTK